MCVVAERSVIWLSVFLWSKMRCTSRASHGGPCEDKKSSVKPGRKPSGGEIGSENVDMSSDKQGERPCRRKSKGSCLKLI